jgi:hypothetical protein
VSKSKTQGRGNPAFSLSLTSKVTQMDTQVKFRKLTPQQNYDVISFLKETVEDCSTPDKKMCRYWDGWTDETVAEALNKKYPDELKISAASVAKRRVDMFGVFEPKKPAQKEAELSIGDEVVAGLYDRVNTLAVSVQRFEEILNFERENYNTIAKNNNELAAIIKQLRTEIASIRMRVEMEFMEIRGQNKTIKDQPLPIVGPIKIT